MRIGIFNDEDQIASLAADRIVATLNVRPRDLNRNVARGNLLMIQVDVREAARAEGANPAETLNVRTLAYNASRCHDFLLTLWVCSEGPSTSSPSSVAGPKPRPCFFSATGVRFHARRSERSEKRRRRRTHTLAEDARERFS